MKVERENNVPLSSIGYGETFELVENGVPTTYMRTGPGAKSANGKDVTAISTCGSLVCFETSRMVIAKKYKLVPDRG